VSADVDSLNWIKDKIDSDELKITWNMIGYVQNQSKEAMNEMQVMGNLQSRETVILDVKSNFERAETFVVETMARLRYGAAYLGSVIFYGETFYFQSVESIRTGIQDSKDAGLPQFEIISQQKQLLNTKYQNNPDMLERVKILMAIEPYQGYSLDDLIRLDQRYPLDPMRVLIKTNFHEYVARFEREFTNIVNFMPFSDFRERVEFIQTIIESYAEQDRAAAADTSGGAGGTQAPAGLRAGADQGAEPAPQPER
jgi:hypothetical protein